MKGKIQMQKTVYEYLKESKEVLNSMKPFCNMKSYDKVAVTYKIDSLKAEIITHVSRYALGFDFYEFSLDKLQFDGIAIKDCIFKSIEIVDNGLVIECNSK